MVESFQMNGRIIPVMNFGLAISPFPEGAGSSGPIPGSRNNKPAGSNGRRPGISAVVTKWRNYSRMISDHPESGIQID